MSQKRYLFYISQNYSFEILRPLQDEIRRRGDEIKWFAIGDEINLKNFTSNEIVLESIEDAVSYQAHACFVPGNIIPNFIPGIKVQVFHGLEWKKKGHFVIRNCFDLYCTHGDATTIKFKELAKQHGFFDVVETGWPKLDYLFTINPAEHFRNQKPKIIYAPTFSPSLTSAPALVEEIKTLVAKNSYNWIVKFHPKMAPEWIKEYKAIKADNFKVVESCDINELLQWADIMVSDTSSVIGEFSLLNKPVISLKNSDPSDYLIDIQNAQQLPEAITQALTPSKKLLNAISQYANALHPYQDGQSSARILNAVENIISNGKENNKSLPINLFRNLKQRKQLNYWQW